MKDIVFNNSSRRFVRIFFMLTLFFAAAAIVPLIVLRVQAARGVATDSVREGCVITSFIMIPLGIAMLLSALLTIPVARRTDRAFKAFQAGDLLVRWEYEPDIWSQYIEKERRRLRKIAGWVYVLIFVPFSGLVFFAVWQFPETRQGKINASLIVVAGAIAFAVIYYLIARWIIGVRMRAMAGCPGAFVGRNAVYAGGMFAFWGSQLRGLQSARVLPGPTPADPHIIELMVGFSRNAQRAAGVVDLINALVGSGSASASMTQRLAVMIPPGEEARAREIVDILVRGSQLPPPAKRAVHASAPVPTAPSVAFEPELPPDPAMLRQKARRWGMATILLIVGGLILFLVAGATTPHQPSGANAPSDILAVLGLFAWMASPIALIVWIVKRIRARRAAQASS